MHELVIRNGKIVDGSGAPAFTGDVAIDNGVITSVGRIAGSARREIDATGLLVTPGWVDIHTHYDGQVTWDPFLSPSSWHGVTTIVMGNCGVGFAPVQPGQQEFLIGLMEGVEDIPGAALSEGIKFTWESFPEYMNAIEKMPRVLDIGAQIPHGSLRTYVMGERGARNEEATVDDIATMAALVRDSLRAGALGFTTSRTMLHRAKNKDLVPGTFASEAELLGIGRAMGEVGHGVFE
ncbi:MAG TPA: amidohydrolase family protein, partial [Candidatus Dormibacteraeota bacterium]|nr:amidohydrolase family protein [Candidatus Dormibacteraeota bacterium]